jgi:hypothetical protein
MNRRTFIAGTVTTGVAVLAARRAFSHNTIISHFKNQDPMQSSIPAPEIQAMLAAAIQAPSSHNTQPWRFALTGEGLILIPDFSRRLPQADPDDREFWIGQGCALENIAQAASEFGYDACPVFRDDRIEIALLPSGESGGDLYSYIDRRQTNRAPYDGRPIPAGDLRQLGEAAGGGGVQVRFISLENERILLLDLIRRANEVQLSDKAYKRELLGWIRFNRREVEKHRDGLCYHVMGTPPVPAALGRMFATASLKPDKQDKADAERIQSAPVLVLISAPSADAQGWIEAGRAFQRFALTAEKLGLAHAHHNAPLQVPALRGLVAERFCPGAQPALLLRLGYAQRQPLAPRRIPENLVA